MYKLIKMSRKVKLSKINTVFFIDIATDLKVGGEKLNIATLCQL